MTREDVIEEMAKAICGEYNRPYHVAWEDTNAEWIGRYRRLADAALARLESLGVIPSPPAPQE